MSRPQLTVEEYGDWFDAVRGNARETMRDMADKFPGIADLASYEGETALHIAADAQKADLVDFLLALGAKPDPADENDRTPLVSAACSGNTEIMAALIAKGAHVETRFGAGLSTPLHCAAHNGHLAAVKLLVENGADLLAKTGKGLTALQEAQKKGRADCAQYLEREMSRNAFSAEAKLLTEGLARPIHARHSIVLRPKKEASP